MIQDFNSDQLSAFQAYSRLTVVSHVRNQRETNSVYKNNEVSFKDFNEVLKQEQVVNPSLSRKVDQWMKEHSDVQRKNHGNGDMESKTMSYIEKAYNLGFVDMNGSLYRAKT